MGIERWILMGGAGVEVGGRGRGAEGGDRAVKLVWTIVK